MAEDAARRKRLLQSSMRGGQIRESSGCLKSCLRLRLLRKLFCGKVVGGSKVRAQLQSHKRWCVPVWGLLVLFCGFIYDK